MREEIICAGFGGQGIMLLGKVLAQAALKENRQVSWIPSYGAAIRGGTAFCMVIISDRKIGSAYVDKCDTLFVFNQPSWNKFKSRVKNGGLVLFNSTLIKDRNPATQLKVRKIPFTEIASSLGLVQVANMVALGAFLKEKQIVKRQTIYEVFSEIAPADKRHLLQVNRKALAKGYNSL
jgi:2-oxoglutarate ferredoxin oxidoreductase subunit gamma